MKHSPLVLAALALVAGQALAQTTTDVSVGAVTPSVTHTGTGPLTASVSGAGLDGRGSGGATASAGFGSLGVSASGEATPAEAFPTLGAAAEASATDTLFVSGTPGVVASLHFSISLEGGCFATDGATDGRPNAACSVNGTLDGPPSPLLGVGTGRTSSSTVITWGEGTVLPIGADLQAGGYAWNGSFDASFADTLHIDAWSDTPGVVLTSASGHDDSLPSATPSRARPCCSPPGCWCWFGAAGAADQRRRQDRVGEISPRERAGRRPRRPSNGSAIGR